ncbi:hypothetical protein, partial [Streptomyces mirabilis]|uniref:hypothetical protein n=1 Tax=Streptomyces mirabilis TaxID=68239 RepID=UPI0033E6650A
RDTRHRLNTGNQTRWVRTRPSKLGQDSAAADSNTPNRTGERCQPEVVTGTSQYPVRQGSWSAYGAARRKEKDAEVKKRRIRKKR